MAVTSSRTDTPGNCFLYTWVLLTANTDGVGVQIPGASDKTLQFTGTFGGPPTCILEGSNDSTTGSDGTWTALNQAKDGTAITTTAAAIFVVLENPLWIRPRLSAGGSGATVNALLLCKPT